MQSTAELISKQIFQKIKIKNKGPKIEKLFFQGMLVSGKVKLNLFTPHFEEF